MLHPSLSTFLELVGMPMCGGGRGLNVRMASTLHTALTRVRGVGRRPRILPEFIHAQQQEHGPHWLP